MSRTRTTLTSPHFWASLRVLPTSSANSKLRNWPITEGFSSDQFVSSFHSCIPSKPMSYFLFKSTSFGNSTLRTLPPVGGNPNVFQPRWFSSSLNEQSFTVSYLINSVGLSPETALSASKHVNFHTPEKADKVINLFKKYGFTPIQISSLVRITPRLLLLDAEEIILPKLEFFESKGISGPEMAKMLSAFPTVLTVSLDKQIIPSYDFFRSLFQSDEKVLAAVKKFPDLLKNDIEKYVSPRIEILREYSVPDSNIARLVILHPRVFIVTLDRLREVVEKVGEMGFDGSKVTFVLAIYAFLSMSKSTWERKVDAYKKWGYSEEEILKTFKKRPSCMMLSEDKIMVGMDFLINKMGSTPCLVAKQPQLLSLSMEKRLMPRYSVFQVLLSKGLVKKEISLAVFFTYSEIKFLQKFVTPYKNEAPEILKLYKDKLNLTNGLLAAKV